MNKFSSLVLFCGLFLCLYASAQTPSYNLYINNKTHNSYDQVKANQPYQIWLKDTASLKGYFDAVYENTFLFFERAFHIYLCISCKYKLRLIML